MSEEDTLDKILVDIGGFGKYQLLAVFLICLVVITNSSTHMAYVFTAMDSDYRCLIPLCDGSEPEYQTDWMENAIPFSSLNKPSKCDMFATISNSSWESNKCSASRFNKRKIEHCNSFVFEDDENYIGREYSLLCDDQLWKLTLVGTLNTAGSFFGLLITGIISDRYGRKIILIFGMMLCGMSGIVKSFAPTVIWFYIFEFLEGLFAAGSYVSACVLVVEIVVSESRIRATSVIFTCYAIGEVLLAVVSWAVRDWRLILYIIYGPCILLFTFYWIIPESIRWNLSRGEVEKARETLNKIANSNGKSVPEAYFKALKMENEKQTNNLLDIIKSMPLFLRLVNCSFLWVACALLFYGLSLTSVTLAGNSYLDFVLISLAEIPAYWMSYIIGDKIGRKPLLSTSFGITFVACFGFVFLEGKMKWLEMVLYCLGKFGATLAFILIYAVTSELFPTLLRHTAMSMCSMIARLGVLISPQITLLDLIWKPLPLVLFAAIAVMACIVSLLVPETLNIQLPDTIKEAENIKKRHPNSVNHAA